MKSDHSRMGHPAWTVISSALLFVVCVMLCVWAVVTFVRRGEFDAAARSVFTHDPHADVTVFWLRFTYIAGPVFSAVLGIVYAVLGLLLLCRSYEWVPVVAVLLSVPAAAIALFAYVLSGRWYISAINTGPDKSAAIREMAMVDRLTRWRFTGWYHFMSVGFGVTILICLASAVAVLVSAAGKGRMEKAI